MSTEKRYSLEEERGGRVLLKRAVAAFCWLNGKMEEWNEGKGEEKPLSR